MKPPPVVVSGFSVGVPIGGVDTTGDFQFLRVTRDGYAMLHPDVLAILQRLEAKIDALVWWSGVVPTLSEEDLNRMRAARDDSAMKTHRFTPDLQAPGRAAQCAICGMPEPVHFVPDGYPGLFGP